MVSTVRWSRIGRVATIFNSDFFHAKEPTLSTITTYKTPVPSKVLVST